MDADFLLIRKMKQGDEKAFDVFVHKYYEEILKYCTYHCLDMEYAKDLTQETFIRFFAKLSDYHYKGKNRNYLYTIAGNLCRDYYKRSTESPLDEQILNGQSDMQENMTETVIEKMTMDWALKQLPEELREILILYYFQELKLSEIADALQIGLPLVKYRIRQAKTQLETLLRKEGLYESGRNNRRI